MRREVRALYLMLLKNQKVLDLQATMEFYDKYNELRELAGNKDIPLNLALRVLAIPTKMPKYLQWVKKYLIRKE